MPPSSPHVRPPCKHNETRLFCKHDTIKCCCKQWWPMRTATPIPTRTSELPAFTPQPPTVPHLLRSHFSPPVIVHIVCVRRPPAVLEHRTMGSYGYRWMQCSWCNVWGRVAWPVDTIQPPIVLFDVDGCGLICEPCYDRGWPPHALYVIHVLRRSRASLPTRVAELIAVYAYAAYAEATVVADQWY